MSPRREIILLALLFGLLYFIQGVAEPTEGLIAQPVRSQLRFLNLRTGEISAISAIISLPWSLKPLFGLLTDYVPLLGYRRKSYLLGATLATTVGLLVLMVIPFDLTNLRSILGWIFVATLGVAFADVVVDALSVHTGQKYGITGRLQAIQWGAMYTATILTGTIGGYLSQHRLPHVGFLICAVLAGVSFLMALLLVHEVRVLPPHSPASPRGEFRAALSNLWATLRSPLTLTVGAFLFLWAFNPFSSSVQESYMTYELHQSPQFIGHMKSLFAVGAISSCLVYGLVGQRLPLIWLVHGSIGLGVLSSLAYWGMHGQASTIVVSLVAGFCYMLGTLVQLDVAARACDENSAGTTFALLMALSNLGASLSGWVGGHWYDWLAMTLGNHHAAYHLLVGSGAICTAACWFLVPLMRRSGLFAR